MSQASSINRSIVRSVLTQRATVYGRAAGTGPFSQVLKSGLACRLERASISPTATSAQRADLAKLGTLMYDAEYTMPESGIQIEVDLFPGIRWNPVAATDWPEDAPGIGVISKSLDVVRAN